MRKAAILWILLIGMIGMAPQQTTAQVSVSFQLFYDNLSPHGYWIENPGYGYVWVPNVSRGFTPYRTNGYWAYTEMGWTWVSDYSWGWAPFHYGRWYYDAYYGWAWVPDTHWGPAWVTWRYYDGYYGWAPIGPGVSVNMAYSNSYSVPSSHWVLVREADFGRRNISNYYVNASNNAIFVSKARVVNNIHTNRATKDRYHAGPTRAEVQKRSKTTITQVSLKERNRPGQSVSATEIQLYKPRVVKEGNKSKKPAPAIVTRQNEVKSVNDRRNTAIPKREVKKEVKREKPTVLNQPLRQPVSKNNRSTQYQRELQQEQRRQENEMKQQQRRQEMEVQQGEKRARELEQERRMKEPVQPLRDNRVQPNEPLLQQNRLPQTRRQDMPLQHINNQGHSPNRQKNPQGLIP